VPGATGAFHRILVAFDGSTESRRALANAIAMARSNNATLTIVTVAPEPTLWTYGESYGTPVDLFDVNQVIENHHEALLREAADAVPEDLSVTPLLKTGSPPGRGSSTQPAPATTTSSSWAHAATASCAPCCWEASATTCCRPALSRCSSLVERRSTNEQRERRTGDVQVRAG
jgi:hypothetical protein